MTTGSTAEILEETSTVIDLTSQMLSTEPATDVKTTSSHITRTGTSDSAPFKGSAITRRDQLYYQSSSKCVFYILN